MSGFIEELRWRGLLHDMMPGTEDLLAKEKVTGYIGFDPTSDSLHIGSMSQILTLMRFQRAGHRPIALIGGATGMVGDPSGKSAERNLLDEPTLNHNVEGIRKQLTRFLDFSNQETGAILLNNYDWMRDYSFLNFIRDVGKHMSVNYMMAKDSVKNRLETGMSFTEFSYQLIQAYDFFKLYSERGCKLQMGGSDQWGNITTGTELIRRRSGEEAFGLTTVLITKADGTKFGKTEGGNIWLDRNKTSPYKFYQYWINVSDQDAESGLMKFTFLTQSQIAEITEEHRKNPGGRALQKALAKELTVMVHSEADYNQAVEASKVLFSDDLDTLVRLDERTFNEIFEGVPRFDVPRSALEQQMGVLDFLAGQTAVFPSKGEARKMIQAGGVSINKQKVSGQEMTIGISHLIREKYILVQKGKKNYYLCSVN